MAVDAGGCCSVAAAAVETIAAVVFVVAMAVDATDGVVDADGSTASATTRLASTLLGRTASKAGADAQAEVSLSFRDALRDPVDHPVGCSGAMSAALASAPLTRRFGAGTSAREVSGAPGALAVGVAASEEVDSRFSDAASPSSDALVAVRAPPVPSTRPGSAERLAGWDDGDPDVPALIGDPADVSVDPEALDGADADGPDKALVPEGVASFDEERDPGDAVDLVDDASEEEDGDVLDPDVSADATPHPYPVITAAPTPKATASPPTRPTYAAWAPACTVFLPRKPNAANRFGRHNAETCSRRPDSGLWKAQLIFVITHLIFSMVVDE